MHNFRTWLTEEFNSDDYEGRKPHHIYHTEHGHLMHVHIDKDEHGSHAVFVNKTLGGVTKYVSWKPEDRKSTRLNSSHT